MLTKSTIKFIKSLQEKKYRKQEQCFIVEGAKSVAEVLNSDFEVLQVIGTEDYFRSLNEVRKGAEFIEAKASELATLGDFVTNDAAIAVVRMKINPSYKINDTGITLFLDDIRDPGNLGTIIRTADWFGINTILASEETVDFYSPKVINSTKGSFARVQFVHTNLVHVLQNISLPVYGAFLDGKDIHHVNKPASGVLIIGNESKGISAQVGSYVTEKITIPRIGKAESLNAAIATAIIIDNLLR